MKKKITCIIQARLSSSRLPGKILLNGFDKPLLLHLIERIKKSKKINKIIIATTNQKIDDPIVNLCKKENINYFRGDLENVLKRYYFCAKKFKAEHILRITSDCPLMDFRIVDQVIGEYSKKNYDYVSNINPTTTPDGFDIEIFPFQILKKTYFNAKKKHELEHVTPYIWDNPKKFKILNVRIFKTNLNYRKYRLTLDYLEDYYVIHNIYNSLYSKNKNFSLKDIIKFLNKNNKILLNKKYIKVNWFRNCLSKLKTIKKKDTNLKTK